ncbi:MAG: ABC transporter permease [Deltaproteobacteria bacterium]|nr:MAG: ABC transporter permease [Deltaproteobacteria bacterium]
MPRNFFLDFITLILSRRYLIWELIKREVAAQYIGSRLGFIWTIINPLVLILIFWFVFGFGLKAKPLNDIPFVIWLTAGMAAWFNFSEIWSRATTIVVANPHLVKKVRFPTSILPVVTVGAALVSHVVFLGLLIILLWSYQVPLTFWVIQALYYYLAMVVLVLGLSWLTASVNVFFRDTGQIVQLLLQIGFWGTPIFWDINIMPPIVQTVLKINPIYYIVQGYRDSFIYGIPFWQDWRWGLYFWSVTALILLAGALVFRRLRPHFADVL